MISSEVFFVDNVKLIADARCLPFKNRSLNTIVMTDVLHHIPDVEMFFRESRRVLRVNGKIIMIEPWNNLWAKFIYTNFHHESFDVSTAKWPFPQNGPLSSANGALPWILFQRDREIFDKKFENLSVRKIKPIMPFSYLFSGGLSFISFLPGTSYKFVRFLEKNFFFERKIGMFAFIEIKLLKENKR